MAAMVRTSTSEVAEYYARSRIETAGHKQAIYLLHEKCVHLATKALYFSDNRRQNLDKAQNILAQLQACLIVDDLVSQSLFYLYDFVYATLERGDIADIRSALAVLISLRNTFQTLLSQP
jgi:flagellin-specific chaperone FliS